MISSDVVFFPYVADAAFRLSDEVFVWDLDKTYLDTSWGGVIELLKVAMERPIEKKNVPGTNALVRGLIDCWVSKHGNRQFPLYFITASPPQMESRIAEKLNYDGIFPLGCFYKDNLQNLRPKRLWRLTKQVGYKVQALLQLRTMLREDVKQVLWGDDSEADAVIYNLYSDICARRLGAEETRAILSHFYVTGEQVDSILYLQSQIPENDPVERIYINLATDTDPEYYLKFGRRTLPTYNSFQIVLDLHQIGKVDLEKVIRVGQDMIHHYGFSPEELAQSFDDLIRRQVLLAPFVDDVKGQLKDAKVLSRDFEPTLPPIKSKEEWHEPWVADRIEYCNDYR